MTERERFDAWVVTALLHRSSDEREHMWAAWQAAAAGVPVAEFEKFKSHSISLNRILWRMQEILGNVGPNDEEVIGDIDSVADAFFAKVTDDTDIHDARHPPAPLAPNVKTDPTLLAQLSAAAGVPREPTEAMLTAGYDALSDVQSEDETGEIMMARTYRAMIAAAPQEPDCKTCEGHGHVRIAIDDGMTCPDCGGAGVTSRDALLAILAGTEAERQRLLGELSKALAAAPAVPREALSDADASMAVARVLCLGVHADVDAVRQDLYRSGYEAGYRAAVPREDARYLHLRDIGPFRAFGLSVVDCEGSTLSGAELDAAIDAAIANREVAK